MILRQRKVQADWREIEEFLTRATRALAPVPFSICLVSDASMRRYNARFRGKNEPTDVLSFPAGKAQFGVHADRPAYVTAHHPAYLGDIVISAETARRNASAYGVRLEDEINALILHGLLHLLGHDHERDRGQMARAERLWGARLGLPWTLLARSQSFSENCSAQPSKSGSPRPARRLRIAGKR